MEKRWTITR